MCGNIKGMSKLTLSYFAAWLRSFGTAPSGLQLRERQRLAGSRISFSPQESITRLQLCTFGTTATSHVSEIHQSEHRNIVASCVWSQTHRYKQRR